MTNRPSKILRIIFLLSLASCGEKNASTDVENTPTDSSVVSNSVTTDLAPGENIFGDYVVSCEPDATTWRSGLISFENDEVRRTQTIYRMEEPFDPDRTDEERCNESTKIISTESISNYAIFDIPVDEVNSYSQSVSGFIDQTFSSIKYTVYDNQELSSLNGLDGGSAFCDSLTFEQGVEVEILDKSCSHPEFGISYVSGMTIYDVFFEVHDGNIYAPGEPTSEYNGTTRDLRPRSVDNTNNHNTYYRTVAPN